MHLAILVYQERAQEKRGLRCNTRCDRRLDCREARDEVPVAPGELPEVPAPRDQLAVGSEACARAVQQQGSAGAGYFAQRGARPRQAAGRVGEECRAQLPEPEPGQLVARFTPRPDGRRQYYERPAAVPGTRVL